VPIYEYRCEKGHTFEVMQRMTEDALAKCTVCKAPVQRVFHPIAVHFKGSGFYSTDYGKKGSKPAKESSNNDSGSSSEKSSDSKSSDSGDKAKTSSAKSDSSSSD
jgi:putative FmdB family regulatory protein